MTRNWRHCGHCVRNASCPLMAVNQICVWCQLDLSQSEVAQRRTVWCQLDLSQSEVAQRRKRGRQRRKHQMPVCALFRTGVVHHMDPNRKAACRADQYQWPQWQLNQCRLLRRVAKSAACWSSFLSGKTSSSLALYTEQRCRFVCSVRYLVADSRGLASRGVEPLHQRRALIPPRRLL